VDEPNVCFNDGHLVGGQFEVPEDPSDYCWSSRDPVVGCNRLRCTVCGEAVKQQLGYFLVAELPASRAEWKSWTALLYGQADWSGVPYVSRNAGSRTCVCHCGPVTESWMKGLAISSVDGDPYSGNRIPWTCQGHAAAILPLTLHGERVESHAVAALAQRALQGWAPAVALPTSGGWAETLYRRLGGNAAAHEVVVAARTALTSGNLNARSGAIDFFSWVRDPEANRLLLALARTDRSAFSGFDTRGRDVERILLTDVAEKWSWDIYEGSDVADWLRAEGLKSGAGAAVVEPLAKRDPQWVNVHAEALVRANPETAISILKVLFDAWAYAAFDIEQLARKLAAVPGVSKQVLRAEVERTFFGEARERVLNGIGDAPLS
jgi:hypothetical protein